MTASDVRGARHAVATHLRPPRPHLREAGTIAVDEHVLSQVDVTRRARGHAPAIREIPLREGDVVDLHLHASLVPTVTTTVAAGPLAATRKALAVRLDGSSTLYSRCSIAFGRRSSASRADSRPRLEMSIRDVEHDRVRRGGRAEGRRRPSRRWWTGRPRAGPRRSGSATYARSFIQPSRYPVASMDAHRGGLHPWNCRRIGHSHGLNSTCRVCNFVGHHSAGLPRRCPSTREQP